MPQQHRPQQAGPRHVAMDDERTLVHRGPRPGGDDDTSRRGTGTLIDRRARTPAPAATGPTPTTWGDRWLDDPELIDQAGRGVRLLSVMVIALVLAGRGITLNSWLSDKLSTGALINALAFSLLEIGCALAVFALSHRGGRSLRHMQILASVQFAVSAAISTGYSALDIQPGSARIELSWIALWLLFYGMLIPGSLRWHAVHYATAVALLPGTVAGMWMFGRYDGRAGWTVLQPLLLLTLPNVIAAWVSLSGVSTRIGIRRTMARLHQDLQELGSYRLVKRLGGGGMGEVWEARHALLARPAAIKIVRSELLNEQQMATALKRFELEAQATAALSSPHTVNIFDYGRTRDGAFFYAMELLDGIDLETLVLKHGHLPQERVIFLMAQACLSLHEAHERGLVHRDIKPANILTCRVGGVDDYVKILDFGLVVPAGERPELPDGAQRMTLAGFVIGTPGFMAPEQCKGREVDRRADIYSLGCVMYLLLTGKEVLNGGTHMEIMLAHVNQDPQPPSWSDPNVAISPELDRVVLDCLAKNPAERPQTAMILRARLLACPQPMPWTEARARAWRDVYLPSAATLPLLTPTQVTPRTSTPPPKP